MSDNKMTAEQALDDADLLELAREQAFLLECSESAYLDIAKTVLKRFGAALSAPTVPDKWRLVIERLLANDGGDGRYDASEFLAARDELKLMLAASPEPIAPDQQVIADLRAEVEALRKDAERYRFIRGKFGYGDYGIVLPCGPARNKDALATETDAAIDAARLRKGNPS